MRTTYRRFLLLLALLVPIGVILGVPPGAFGCPFCETDIGKQVNAGVFNDDFTGRLVVTLLPFPILLGIVAFIHFGWPWSRQPPSDDAPQKAPPTTPTH